MKAERLFDVALGASLLGWSMKMLPTQVPSLTEGLVTGSVFALNALVAALFFLRKPEEASGGFKRMALALPGVLIAGAAFVLAPSPSHWPLSLASLFAAGAVFAVVSLATLGRSFSVLPAKRDLVVRGPYSLVRHPAYLGELVMLGAACFSANELWAGLVPFAAATVVAVRIEQEEDLLTQSKDYEKYRREVRFRLFPGLW